MDQMDLGAASLAHHYCVVRAETEARAAPLSAEDQGLQSMPDASPVKWHRAHTTWFFETFVLLAACPDYQAFDPAFGYLFNSYYEAVGPRHSRAARGLLSRPGTERITAYRAYVDAAMLKFLPQAAADTRALVVLGLQHEQQHQELIWTDILHGFAQNPMLPVAVPGGLAPNALPGQTQYRRCAGGLVTIGHDMAGGFAFDNETPRHQVYLAPFEIADCPVRNRDFTDFIDDGGYANPALWMADGFAEVQAKGWRAPIYWEDDGMEMSLAGFVMRDPAAPVRHMSWYEADAFARWAGARLPTEAEFEFACADPDVGELYGLANAVWQWTASAYLPYPGFAPAAGAVGEYNGKFMINQMVLRGGSCATPDGHARRTYRNFFPPATRWQFAGLRLARNI